MPSIPITDSGHYRPYTKTAGSEPLPGYRLLSPLGRGGFGEVWKCEAPGGLHKAIKFVASEAADGRGVERFGQELAAFEQIKAIRHPFLLTLERVEQLDGDLVMVMELADRQLQDRFRECQSCGLPGIPRDELLAYFADAAEALDVISAKHGLQHLDIKPANLFLVAGHVKVGDYGLVAQLEGSEARNRGLTPRYAPPEVLNGAPSSSSDQYSLALVYAELLTGTFPYPGRTPQQLMLQHVTGQPDLSALPPCDRAALGRALAKQPEDRFPSCLAFVQALLASGAETALPAAAMALRRARVDRSVAEMTPAPLAGDEDYPGGASSVSARGYPTQPDHPEARPEPTLPSKPHPTLPGGRTSTLPRLVSGNQKSGPQNPGAPKAPPNPRLSTDAIKTPAPHGTVGFKPPAPPEEVVAEAGMVVLDPIRSIVPVARLLGKNARDPRRGAAALAAAVVEVAAAGTSVPQLTGEAVRLADGSWVCRFPSTVPATVVPLKLAVVRDAWGVAIEQPDPTTLVLRRTFGGGGFFGGKKKYGYEVTVTLPPPTRPLGEMTAVGRVFGSPEAKFAREALDIVPKILAEVRGLLCNVAERRKHPRIACRLAATIYPVHSDGGIDAAMPVTCRDVSVGGVGFVSARLVPTRYAFIAFTGVPALAEYALLLRLMRVQPVDGGRDYGAHFRTDL